MTTLKTKNQSMAEYYMCAAAAAVVGDAVWFSCEMAFAVLSADDVAKENERMEVVMVGFAMNKKLQGSC